MNMRTTEGRPLVRRAFRAVILLLLCGFFLLPLVRLQAAGADVGFGAFSNGVRWRFTSAGTLVISGAGEIPDFSMSSPAPWAVYAAEIREIRVEEDVVSVGAYAFLSLAVQSVRLPAGLHTIGEGAFMDCGELKRLQIPEGVLYVGRDAFSGCVLLHKLYLPLTIEEIGETAFASCSALSELYYPGDAAAFNAIAVAKGNDALRGAELYPHYVDRGNLFVRLLIVSAMIPVLTLTVCLYRRWRIRCREEEILLR